MYCKNINNDVPVTLIKFTNRNTRLWHIASLIYETCDMNIQIIYRNKVI